VIARLTGKLVARDDPRGVIDVQGVGWEVFAPSRAFDAWTSATDPVEVHVSTQVREDSIQLFGFPTELDRRCFVALLSVSGVGPKLALATLDGMAPERLAQAIEADDLVSLSRIPGVGKKTAQRLALELKGKLQVGFTPLPPPAPVKKGPADPLPLALAQLDYGRAEIERALSGLVAEGIGPEAPLSDRLRGSLRILSRAPQ
jgi:Holliday junction DNA helicase RuvA